VPVSNNRPPQVFVVLAENRFPGSGTDRVLGPKPVLSPNLDIIIIIILIIVPNFYNLQSGDQEPA
jgi:hypothetical protein